MHSSARGSVTSASRLSLAFARVAEYLTALPSASPASPGTPYVSTNPDPISVDQEPLGLRWTGFSPVLSLLMPTVSLPTAPKPLTGLLLR